MTNKKISQIIDKELLELRKQYGNFEKNINHLVKCQKKVLEELQSKCPHPLVAETDSINTVTDISQARICEICGYEEEEGRIFNGYGYKTLTNEKVRNIIRDEFYKLRKPLHEIKL